MTFQTFAPPLGGTTKFAPGSSEEHAPIVLRNTFGDGYSQRTPDGINYDLAKLSLRWENLTWNEGKGVMLFFRNRNGVEPFYFQLPGETTIRKWICTKWSRTWDGELTVSIAASWEEVPDPE